MSFYICALDDDESTLYTLKAMTQTQGWSFRGATTVDELFGWVRNGDADILLLDYHMPMENGLDILRKVKSISLNLPVLMLTIEQDPAIAETLLLAGADDFINKPVRLADFLSRIRLHQRLREQEKNMRIDTRKGLSQNKLQNIVDFLRNKKDGAEIDELAKACALSYTTAHRYLDYLAKTGHVITREVPLHGKPGRPTRSYIFIGIKAENKFVPKIV